MKIHYIFAMALAGCSVSPEAVAEINDREHLCFKEEITDTVKYTIGEMANHDYGFDSEVDIFIDQMFSFVEMIDIKAGPVILERDAQSCSATFKTLNTTFPVEYYIEGEDDVYTVMDKDQYEAMKLDIEPIWD